MCDPKRNDRGFFASLERWSDVKPCGAPRLYIVFDIICNNRASFRTDDRTGTLSHAKVNLKHLLQTFAPDLDSGEGHRGYSTIAATAAAAPHTQQHSPSRLQAVLGQQRPGGAALEAQSPSGRTAEPGPPLLAPPRPRPSKGPGQDRGGQGRQQILFVVLADRTRVRRSKGVVWQG